ncbi:hypothetical protein [Gudongella sp. SC589]|uniref:hypothetical protein n=1 Tax=Gudongella sp. SC589 TaxID=3385990 RepID=UPI003904DD1B
MEKIMTIDGRQVKFKSTAAYLLKYKAQFGRDAIQDLVKVLESVDSKTKEIKDISALDLGVFYDMVWALAKQADPTIPPPMEWLDGFDTFPLLDKENFPVWLEMIQSSFSSSVKSKKKA